MKAILTMANGFFRSSPIKIDDKRETVYMELSPINSEIRRNDAMTIMKNSVVGIFKLHKSLGLIESGEMNGDPIYEYSYEYRLCGFRK